MQNDGPRRPHRPRRPRKPRRPRVIYIWRSEGLCFYQWKYIGWPKNIFITYSKLVICATILQLSSAFFQAFCPEFSIPLERLKGNSLTQIPSWECWWTVRDRRNWKRCRHAHHFARKQGAKYEASNPKESTHSLHLTARFIDSVQPGYLQKVLEAQNMN